MLKGGEVIKKSTFVATILFLVMHATPVIGAGRTFTIIGSSSCTDWIESKRVASLEDSDRLSWISFMQKKTWIMGYVSALNSAYKSNKDILKDVNSDIVADWVDIYCDKNKMKKTDDAVDALFDELVKIAK